MFNCILNYSYSVLHYWLGTHELSMVKDVFLIIRKKDKSILSGFTVKPELIDLGLIVLSSVY